MEFGNRSVIACTPKGGLLGIQLWGCLRRLDTCPSRCPAVATCLQQSTTGKSSAGSLDAFAGHAEHVYSVAGGATPPPAVVEVSSSWQRSANKYGVDPVDIRVPRMHAS